MGWNVLILNACSFLFWNKLEYTNLVCPCMYLRLKAQKAVMDGSAISFFLTDDVSALQATCFMNLLSTGDLS